MKFYFGTKSHALDSFLNRAASSEIHAQMKTTPIQKPMTLQDWPDLMATPIKAAKKSMLAIREYAAEETVCIIFSLRGIRR